MSLLYLCVLLLCTFRVESTIEINVSNYANAAPRTDKQCKMQMPSAEFLGVYSIPAGQLTNFVGGFSGLAYDRNTGDFIALSDEDSTTPRAARFKFSISEQGITPVSTDPISEIFRMRSNVEIDAEALALNLKTNTLYVASENTPVIQEFTLNGARIREVPIPASYSDNIGEQGIESLDISADGKYMIYGTGDALRTDKQARADGIRVNIQPIRLVKYDLERNAVAGQYLYVTEPHLVLTSLLIVDEETIITLERQFIPDFGTLMKLYSVKLGRNIMGVSGPLMTPEGKLKAGLEKPKKQLLLDLGSVPLDGDTPDNLEGTTFGPKLEDGSCSLVIVSDDNFNIGIQRTEWVLLKLPSNYC